MSHVFVSYSKDDIDDVQILVETLRRSGLTVWWDNDIAPGAGWEQQIEAALAAAKAVVVAWTPNSVQRDTVKAEARAALESSKLIQTILKPCKPPLFFREYQWIDLSKWSGDESNERYQNLISAIGQAGTALGLATLKAPPIPFHRRLVRALASWSALAAVGVGGWYLWATYRDGAVVTPEMLTGIATLGLGAAAIMAIVASGAQALMGRRR